MADRDLVASHQTILRDPFAPMFAGKRAAVIGFPGNQSCGDYADWLGALKLLHALGVQVSYTASLPSLNRDELAHRAGQDPIFAVGDIAEPGAAAAMTDLIRTIQGRIVLSPQSLADGSVPAPLAAAIAAHRNSAVFARDRDSERVIEQAFAGKLKPELAPPLAFMLGPQQLKVEPAYDIVWVARTGARDSSVEAAARLSSQSAEK